MVNSYKNVKTVIKIYITEKQKFQNIYIKVTFKNLISKMKLNELLKWIKKPSSISQLQILNS